MLMMRGCISYHFCTPQLDTLDLFPRCIYMMGDGRSMRSM